MNDERAFRAFDWLADAPMFIDAQQVGRFHDAVIVPVERIVSTTTQSGEQVTKKDGGELAVKVSAGIPFFEWLKGEAGGKISDELAKALSQNTSITSTRIDSAQRQLLQLASHYQVKVPNRWFYVTDPGETSWRDPKTIVATPRALAFLDLPGEAEATARGLPALKLIPTAAEFANGKIVQIYQGLHAKNGERPPRYPEKAEDGSTLPAARKKYWSWFDSNFSAVAAMVAIEDAAVENGRIRWIDYRLPLTADGDTLHLHLVGSAEFDTGVFAYNFVKRGYKHGLRLVGTMKSEPDMNVLAVYEK